MLSATFHRVGLIKKQYVSSVKILNNLNKSFSHFGAVGFCSIRSTLLHFYTSLPAIQPVLQATVNGGIAVVNISVVEVKTTISFIL